LKSQEHYMNVQYMLTCTQRESKHNKYMLTCTQRESKHNTPIPQDAFLSMKGKNCWLWS